jgi:hypothetical protein
MANIGVFYLTRPVNHPRFSLAFLKSLLAHDAKADFELVYILKGYDAGATDPGLSRFREQTGRNVHEARVSDEGFDIGAFLKVAASSRYERILFFNSYARILAPAWLAFYLAAFERVANCGIAGATGSYEIIDKAQPFPNVHVRTNAFMIDRKLFLDLEKGPLESRKDCNKFEAGTNGLTRQIMRRGLAPVVVGRNDKTWGIEDWPVSRTFRSGNQENLLVADNRTYDFEAGDPKWRSKLAHLAWGDRADFVTVSGFAQLRAKLRWNYPDTRFPAGV